MSFRCHPRPFRPTRPFKKNKGVLSDFSSTQKGVTMKSRYDLDRSIRVTNMKLKSLRLRKKMDDKMVDKMVLRK